MKSILPIIYQDEFIVVVDKPAGMAAEPAPSWKEADVVSSLSFPTYVVSRLDVGTSGLMLLPKTKPSYQAFKSLYQTRQITKIYTALVEGWMKPKSALIDAPIGRRKAKDMRFGIINNGRPAITQYQVIDRFLDKDSNSPLKFDLVQAQPQTGRTHQIRVHFSAIKHPVVGDQMYGARSFLNLNRYWLHASELHFLHPFSQSQIDLFSTPPIQLQKIISALQKINET